LNEKIFEWFKRRSIRCRRYKKTFDLSFKLVKEFKIPKIVILVPTLQK